MLPSLSCSPLPSQLRPGRPFSLAAARNFARFCRSNLQRSCALRFDSERAFLSLSGAVDYISSLHLTFQSAHFLMACVCFVSNSGIYRSRAPPSTTVARWGNLSSGNSGRTQPPWPAGCEPGRSFLSLSKWLDDLFGGGVPTDRLAEAGNTELQ